MLPSWFTRLRDVNVGSKQNKLHAPSVAAKRHGKDPESFAKSWSLQRANSKAKDARIEADSMSTCNEFCSSISDEAVPLVSAVNACNLQDSEVNKDGMALLMHPCANVDPWDCDFISISSCKVASMPLSSKEIKALGQKGHGVLDNDTEDFAFTSETRSSFCSETSSADSSVSCKSGHEEKGNQDEQYWQEGDVYIKSMGPVKDLQESCAMGEQDGSHCAESSAELMSQKGQLMRRDMWRGRGSFLFSYFIAGRRRSGGSNAESRNIAYERNIGRDRLKISEANCCVVENDSNLTKMSVGKTYSKSSEWEKECLASMKNLPSMKHDRSNAETLDKSLEKSYLAAEANLNMYFEHGDMHRCTSDGLEESSVNPNLAQNVWLEKSNELHSTAENPRVTASSMCCVPPESAEESKQRVSVIRRRRQRGASISAALPPDLEGVVGDSLALVKMSDDPYEDFRQSIYEMIMEKDLEGSMDVEELLYCYLTLNAPEHHELIEEVFSDVWSAILMTLR